MSNPDEIREDIERTRADLGQDVDALADKVNPSKIVDRKTRRVRQGFTNLKEKVMGAADDAGSSAHDAASHVGDAAHHAGDVVKDVPHKAASATRGNPIAVGLIAFGVGWLAASLLPASRAEQQAAERAKDAAAPLVDQVKEVAQETAQNLKEPAKEAAEAVKDRATEAAHTVADEGKSAASDIKDEAQQAAGRSSS
jgi:gas vesicle protein